MMFLKRVMCLHSHLFSINRTDRVRYVNSSRNIISYINKFLKFSYVNKCLEHWKTTPSPWSHNHNLMTYLCHLIMKTNGSTLARFAMQRVWNSERSLLQSQTWNLPSCAAWSIMRIRAANAPMRTWRQKLSIRGITSNSEICKYNPGRQIVSLVWNASTEVQLTELLLPALSAKKHN